MTLKQKIVLILRKFGIDLRRYQPNQHPVARRIRLMQSARINTVFDVGANVGIYGEELRQHGYSGRIVSFEPLSSAFAQLEILSHGIFIYPIDSLQRLDRIKSLPESLFSAYVMVRCYSIKTNH